MCSNIFTHSIFNCATEMFYLLTLSIINTLYLLEFNKRNYLVTKVEEATTDSRQLFQLVGSLLGRKEENPLRGN